MNPLKLLTKVIKVPIKIVRLPKILIEKYRNDKATAKNARHNDVYIVEFPKSGITWFSTILANMALIASGRQEKATFISVGMYVPDIHVTRDIGEVAYDKPPTRLIKSHATFNPNYAFVIYLVRHPLSVMKSYYRYNEESGGRKFLSFDEFCRSDDFGIPAWKRHIGSWLKGNVVVQRMHVCRYEDLIKDPAKEIELLCANFGWDIDDAVIEQALSRATVDLMKGSEELYREKNPRYTMTFVRGHNSANVSEQCVNYIYKECQDELRLLGYE